MEFMNVGGGELLIIILLALVLFSPEDILKLMRTLGKHARTARQMWANVSKNLQDDYIPDEVKEVVKETASSVKEARTTLSSVRKQLNTMTSAVKEDVEDATKLADSELAEAVTTVNTTLNPSEPENKILNVAAESTSQSSNMENALPSLDPSTNNGQEASEIEDLLSTPVDDVDAQFTSLDTKSTDDAITLTKETATKKEDYEGAMHANSAYTKLAKVTEDSLKDGGDDN